MEADLKAPSGFNPDNLVVTKGQQANCFFEHISPKDHERKPLYKGEPAKTYKFELDAFQKKAVDCID